MGKVNGQKTLVFLHQPAFRSTQGSKTLEIEQPATNEKH